ncbi:RNA 2'-phosphotransferase [Saccharopolyspora elongata]|uniref:RNA 2'-phosphotransferase n=1 Tax=Saccharopolyspora elongata TaxID=2530387 RepID=A0A4R4Z8J7_9PSEU|nr:RNA 2'-phosphotransferase [Saccharopolyspora elongata]TDD54010.1 RNA 2'-phosphotransferase [Saccharopolyspora elongata]
MDERRLVRVSKYLAKHLRHQPERIGIELDEHGWVAVDELLAAAGSHGFPISRAELVRVVADNDKQRYVIDGDRIRASEGLRPMNRHHVHLSVDRETAKRVGGRRGRPVVLTVDAAGMHATGHEFRVSANGVWLVDHVRPEFIRYPD